MKYVKVCWFVNVTNKEDFVIGVGAGAERSEAGT